MIIEVVTVNWASTRCEHHANISFHLILTVDLNKVNVIFFFHIFHEENETQRGQETHPDQKTSRSWCGAQIQAYLYLVPIISKPCAFNNVPRALQDPEVLPLLDCTAFLELSVLNQISLLM